MLAKKSDSDWPQRQVTSPGRAVGALPDEQHIDRLGLGHYFAETLTLRRVFRLAAAAPAVGMTICSYSLKR